MRALAINCTLKPSPAQSNTDVLARIVLGALEKEGVETELIRALDHDIDIGFTAPGQNWTYWNRGPGPGPSYLETDEGHDWSRSTGEAAASNLLAVARALQAAPVPAPPG